MLILRYITLVFRILYPGYRSLCKIIYTGMEQYQCDNSLSSR